MDGLILGFIFLWLWFGGALYSLHRTRWMYTQLTDEQQKRIGEYPENEWFIEFIAHFFSWPYVLLYKPKKK